MKKFAITAVAVIAAIVLSLGIVACTDPEAPGGVEQPYKITCESGDNYSVTGLEEQAVAGEKVEFTVESTSVFYTVGAVTMNGEALTGSNSDYSFTMPEAEVEIKVTMSPVGEYDDESDHLSWAPTETGQISLSGGDSAQILLQFDGITSGNLITDIEETIYSSDESVIPTSAITFVPETVYMGNAIIGGKLIIDMTNVHAGETYIYVNLDPNNSSLGTLIRKFTVIEGAIEYPTMTVTLTFTNRTEYPESDILLNITDIDAGTSAQSFWLGDYESGEIAFDYAIGHTYLVTCAYAVTGDDGFYDMTTLYIDEWQTGMGDNASSLERNDRYPGQNTLKVTAEGVEVPLIIDDSE